MIMIHERNESMENILITTEGIQKTLKNYKPLDAICEYIWNGFDALATTVSINLHYNQLEIIDSISIVDNGTGIKYDELKIKFQPFHDSDKSLSSNSNHSIPHGRYGIGRLTFFSFAQTAKWITVYNNDDSNYEYFIEMKRDSLNIYNDNNKEAPIKTIKPTGTAVFFNQLVLLSKDEIIESIKKEFFWFLELNKNNNYKIFVDDVEIDYSEFILEQTQINTEKLKLSYDFDVSFVQWNISLGKEYSKFYYIDFNNQERYKIATKLNKQSDNFYHSVYIKSNYFDQFILTEDEIEGQISFLSSQDSDEFKRLLEFIKKYLQKRRKSFYKEDSNKFINSLIDRNLYPVFNTKNFIDSYRKHELDNLVETLYTAQPKIFTGMHDENKKIFLHLLNMIMDNDNQPELFNVLKNVVELEEDELQELSIILQHTTLSNITKTIKLIEDRVKAVQQLKELVFREDLDALEVPHIQTLVENHYWLFGEQYNLITAAEPDFEQALKGLIYAETGKLEDVKIDHKDKNKEMDIFMLRQDRHKDIIDNVVVELKRPTVPLGEKELSQLKSYMRVIQKTPRFNSDKHKWTYFLIGSRFNNNGYMDGEIRSHKGLGERNLVHEDGNHKIYVFTWSDIFADFTYKYNYLLEKLNLDKKIWLEKHSSADEIIENIKDNSAAMPSALIQAK